MLNWVSFWLYLCNVNNTCVNFFLEKKNKQASELELLPVENEIPLSKKINFWYICKTTPFLEGIVKKLKKVLLLFKSPYDVSIIDNMVDEDYVCILKSQESIT